MARCMLKNTILVSLLAMMQAQVQAEAPLPAIASAKAQKALLIDVAAAGTRLVAVGERGHIVLSDDKGETWRQAAVPVRSLLTAVYFVDDRNGWAVGHESTVLATVDAGATWTLQNYKEFEPAGEPSEAELAAEDAALDEEYVEEDNARVVGSREGVPLLDVWFADSARGIAVGAYGLMLRTVDGGKSWRDVSETVANREGWHFNAIAGAPGPSSVVIIAGEKGTLYRSVDSGATFAPASSPYGGSFFGATSTRNGSFYVYGLQGSLFRSGDGGGNWTRIETGISSGLNDGCELADGRVLIAGNAGVLLSVGGADSVFAVERRSDRQSVLSCAPAGKGVAIVGEGGAKQSLPPKASR